MQKAQVSHMTEFELIQHVNDLKRKLDGQDDARKTIKGEGGDFVDDKMTIGRRDPNLIRQLTLAREALKRVKRKDLTDAEKQEILKTQLMFPCDECKDHFKRSEAVHINRKQLCKPCAKKELK